MESNDLTKWLAMMDSGYLNGAVILETAGKASEYAGASLPPPATARRLHPELIWPPLKLPVSACEKDSQIQIFLGYLSDENSGLAR